MLDQMFTAYMDVGRAGYPSEREREREGTALGANDEKKEKREKLT
jgi:hypothetical protein